MAETSEREDQPDRQDGRKRANGDDGNFEMNVIIPESHLTPHSDLMLRRLKWILVVRLLDFRQTDKVQPTM
jgi:hypothetical protein